MVLGIEFLVLGMNKLVSVELPDPVPFQFFVNN
jgi:hypothetical protein